MDVHPGAGLLIVIERYFSEPYRFVPPFRGRFWCFVESLIIGSQLRRGQNVQRWHIEGASHLRTSLDEGAGIVVAANHCRWADPLLLGALSVAVRQYFYYLVSYHLFKQGRFLGWWLRRIGGYSIWREGADRESLRESARILAAAERPLAIFPEGTWFRQNDRVGPLQEGVGLMLRQAAKLTDRPLRVHPVAIKYWLLEDPTPELRRRLARLESRLGWQPPDDRDLVPRIEKLCDAIVTLKELEWAGEPRIGHIDDRVRVLCDDCATALEKQYLGKSHAGAPLERIRRLRVHLCRRLSDSLGDPADSRRVRRALDMLLTCENLNGQSLDYLHERPSLERLTESVQRLEETVLDEVEAPVAAAGAVVSVGPALDGRQTDRLLADLADALQRSLNQSNAAGPPAEWNCPPDPCRTRALPE